MAIFVTGAGRSGTSALAGLLSKSPIFMGDNLYPPRDSNPKGFFESPDVNYVNDQLIRDSLAIHIESHPDCAQFPQALLLGHPWLAVWPPGMGLQCRPNQVRQIQTLVNHTCFCYKDPRFLLTLPAWLEHLSTAPRVLCAFRDPGEVIFSMVRECLSSPYLHNFAFSIDLLFLAWTSSYLRFLDTIWLTHGLPVKFVLFDELVHGTCIPDLEAFLNMPLDRSFPEPTLKRSQRLEAIPEHATLMIGALQRIAKEGDPADPDIVSELDRIRRVVSGEIAERSVAVPEQFFVDTMQGQMSKAALSESLRALNRAEEKIRELDTNLAGLHLEKRQLHDQLLDLQARVERLPRFLRIILGLSSSRGR